MIRVLRKREDGGVRIKVLVHVVSGKRVQDCGSWVR